MPKRSHETNTASGDIDFYAVTFYLQFKIREGLSSKVAMSLGTPNMLGAISEIPMFHLTTGLWPINTKRNSPNKCGSSSFGSHSRSSVAYAIHLHSAPRPAVALSC